MDVIELIEEENKFFSFEELNESVAISLYSDRKHRISVTFPTVVNRTYSLYPNGWVGFIRLNEDHSIRILPKVPIKNLFRMLEYVYKLKVFDIETPDIIDVNFVEDIYESLADILTSKILDRNRKGVYRSYLEKEDVFSQVRGRILVVPSTKSVLRGSSNIYCSFDDHTADLIENQILAWTLYLLSMFPFKRHEVRQKVRQAYRELINKVSLVSFQSRECLDIFYNRLNQDYEPMHAICRFFLENGGPGIEQGENNFIPFAIHMPTLYESFVAEWLKENVPSGYQISHSYRFNLDSQGNIRFVIDLILIDTKIKKAIAVIDTKYKREYQPSSGDIQQVVAYAVSMQTNHAFLLFPSSTTKEDNYSAGSIHIHSLVFDLAQDPHQAGIILLGKLFSIIGLDP